MPSVHWNINLSPQKQLPFLPSPLLKSVNCLNPVPPFRQFLLYIGFPWIPLPSHPTINRSFSWNRVILKFSLLTLSHVLKETKFLVNSVTIRTELIFLKRVARCRKIRPWFAGSLCLCHIPVSMVCIWYLKRS